MLNRAFRLLIVGTAALLVLGCSGGSVAFREGHKAELRKDYDTALVNYGKALQAEPENAKYLIHEKVAREQASLFHLKRGHDLLKQGRPDEAAGEFQKAVGIDPTNQAAAQELGRLLAAQAAAKRAREAAIQKAMEDRQGAAYPAEVQLKSFPKEPLAHFRISADSRRVYETLAKLADLNVAFTTDFQPRPISLDLTNMRIEDAFLLVGYQSKSFWKAITPNTILVIPDTPANRRDYQDEVLKTVYLSNPLQPADRTAITTALKQILGLQRIIDNPDSNAIIIRDTPDKVAAAEKLIRDLDRGKAEILIEVAVVEADRNRVRDLGLSPATITSATSITTGVQGAVVFNPKDVTLGSLGSRNYSLVIPSAIANAVLNDSRTHILQNPQIRTTDGQTAKLRIGSRVPFATGSFLPSFGATTGGGTAAQPGFGLLASTQFQFQDVGVNLDITPHLLSNGEVSLHASIEVSSLGPPANFGGFPEPTFNQRKIEHDIRLKEGEVNLLGGLIESTDTRTVSGTPGLGQLPLLRYLFSTERHERVETEVLVMLTPRVIRLPEFVAEGTKRLSGAEGEMAAPEPAQVPQPAEPQQ